MKNKFALFIFILTIAFAFAFSCSRQEEYYSVEVIDGVRHVHNNAPIWGYSLRISLEFVQKIGDLETEDENFMLYEPRDVAVDGNGNIYISDSGNCRIQKYDKHGKYLATFGRRGLGPSEFQMLGLMQVLPDNKIFVSDFYLAKTLVLDPNGKEIRRFSIPDRRIYRFIVMHSGELLSDGYLRSYSENEKEPYIEPLLKVFDEELNVKREFCDPLDFGDRSYNQTMNTIYYTIDRNDSVFVTFLEQNRIEKYTPEGILVWKADRLLDYKMSKPKPGRGSGKINYFSKNIAVDGKGRAWVQTVIKQSSGSSNRDNYIPSKSILEVYENDGTFLCRIPYIDIDKMRTYRIFGDRIFFVDEKTEMAVYEYRIVEK